MTKKRDIREELANQYNEGVTPLSIVERFKEPDKDYRFVRMSILGQADYRLEEAAMQGYTPVPIEKITSGFNNDPLNRNTKLKEYYCVKDTILMERPIEFSIRDRERLAKKNRSAMSNLRGVSDDSGAIGTTFRTIRH